jgi:hypothetical protein
VSFLKKPLLRPRNCQKRNSLVVSFSVEAMGSRQMERDTTAFSFYAASGANSSSASCSSP